MESAIRLAERTRAPSDGAIDNRTIADVRAIDPTAFLQACGYRVSKDGQRHLSVRINGDEYYRITRQKEGHYVACDNYGNGIGDNIALYREIAGCGFADAVYALAIGKAAMPKPQSHPKSLSIPRIPTEAPQLAEQSRDRGRNYLAGRGISRQTLEAAEKVGFLKYLIDGILFIGRDLLGVVRSVTKRATDCGDEVQKRDFAGTDKIFPAILNGGKTVWIVEGGVDALAAHDLAAGAGMAPPTLIVSGGANVCGFIDQPHIRDILSSAERIVVVHDRETTPDKQALTDAGHARQVAMLKRFYGAAKVYQWTPPMGKDIAEYLIITRDRTTENGRTALDSPEQPRNQIPHP